MEKKAAIYIRVSTDAQREEGYSIEAQKEMLTAHCVSKGIKNYEYYIDGGWSGSNIDRPEMQRLIEDVQNKRIKSVIVYKLDRLSRSQKDTLYLIEDVFNPNGVDFVSLNESMDTSTPLGRLMLGILSAFAQLERENIRERTRMGMKERVKSGLWMGGGNIPFGYDYDRGRGILVPNDDAETVRRIYDLYIKGYSTGRIAAMVGLKYDRLVQQILKRKLNTGTISYKGKEYKGLHQPIVSEETYEKAMECMKSRSTGPNQESGFLLTGLLVCGKCGAKMRYQKWGKSGYKIVCYSRDKSKRHLAKDPECDNELHWAGEIEDAVLSDLFAFRFEKTAEGKNGEVRTVISILREREREITKQLRRLYGLYGESGDEILLETIEELKNQLEKIKTDIKDEDERSILSQKIKSAKERIETLEEGWDYMTGAERREIILSCIEKVVVDGEEVSVHYKFGDFTP